MKTSSVKEVKPKTNKSAKQDADLPANQRPVKMALELDAINAVEEEEEETGLDNSPKVKVTFYLSEDAVEYLEDTQRRLRKLNRTEGRRKSKSATSKSAILEEAVRLVCSELEEQGMKSQLARVLL